MATPAGFSERTTAGFLCPSVSIKRDVRDYLLAKYPDGGPEGRYHICCRQAKTWDGRLLGRDSLAQTILRQAGRAGEMDKVAADC